LRVIGAADVERALDYPSLVEALRNAFRGGAVAPPRHHHTIARSTGPDATLLLMPAWSDDPAGPRHIGVKIATVFPDNPARDLPTVMGAYLLLDGRSGSPVALIDGPSLTARRTAAASALAARYLARADAERLLMIGTGTLAPYLIEAHASVRPICNVLIWGRDRARAERLAARLDRRDFRVAATDDLASAAAGAHVISCATSSHTALLRGDWIAPGAHVDLVGAYRPDMREADDATIARARIFVDTRAGALHEAGDIVQAIAAGAMTENDIAGDLFDLCRGERDGRRFYDQITLFKSVGASIEDLAAAQLAAVRA
jgi:ornithine cyclodeaminase